MLRNSTYAVETLTFFKDKFKFDFFLKVQVQVKFESELAKSLVRMWIQIILICIRYRLTMDTGTNTYLKCW